MTEDTDTAMNIMRSPILPDEFEMDRTEAETAIGAFPAGWQFFAYQQER